MFIFSSTSDILSCSHSNLMDNIPPNRWPDLFLVDDGGFTRAHFLIYFFHSWFLIKFSKFLILSWPMLKHGYISSGCSSTIWSTPLSIRNLNNKVGMVQRKLSCKSSWKRFLTWLEEVISSISCSLQNSSTIFLSHSDRLVWPPLRSLCINRWFSYSRGSVMSGFLGDFG